MALEEPLSAEEKRKLDSIISDPKKLDAVLDKALKGWHGTRQKKTMRKTKG